jgi:hypothetical protein
MSPIELLDNILTVVLLDYNSTSDNSITLGMLITDFNLKYNMNISYAKMALCLEKICDDGYLENVDGGDVYRVRYNCIAFMNSGGYVAEEQRRSIEVQQRDIQNQRSLRNENWLKFGSVGAAIGGILLFLMEVVKYFSRK